jgi:hypothetical protein
MNFGVPKKFTKSLHFVYSRSPGLPKKLNHEGHQGGTKGTKPLNTDIKFVKTSEDEKTKKYDTTDAGVWHHR